MCVCVYVCVCVYIYMYIYTYICKYIYMDICKYIYMDICKYMYIHIPSMSSINFYSKKGFRPCHIKNTTRELKRWVRIKPNIYTFWLNHCIVFVLSLQTFFFSQNNRTVFHYYTENKWACQCIFSFHEILFTLSQFFTFRPRIHLN